MTLKKQTPGSSNVRKLFSVAIAFVAPLALSIPVQAQEAADKPPAGFNRPLPPAGAVETTEAETSVETFSARGPNFAMALPPGGPKMEGMIDAAGIDMGARFLKGDVAVTDAQYEKLHSLRSEMMDKFGPKVAELMGLMRHLKDALVSEVIDSSQVNDLRSKIIQTGKELADLKIDNEIAVMNVYTPEQRKHLHLAMLKCPALSGGMAGMGRMGGMGGMGGFGHHMRGMHHPGMHYPGMHHQGMGGKAGMAQCPVGSECGDGPKRGGWQPKEGDSQAGTDRPKRGGWQPKSDK